MHLLPAYEYYFEVNVFRNDNLTRSEMVRNANLTRSEMDQCRLYLLDSQDSKNLHACKIIPQVATLIFWI